MYPIRLVRNYSIIDTDALIAKGEDKGKGYNLMDKKFGDVFECDVALNLNLPFSVDSPLVSNSSIPKGSIFVDMEKLTPDSKFYILRVVVPETDSTLRQLFKDENCVILKDSVNNLLLDAETKDKHSDIGDSDLYMVTYTNEGVPQKSIGVKTYAEVLEHIQSGDWFICEAYFERTLSDEKSLPRSFDVVFTSDKTTGEVTYREDNVLFKGYTLKSSDESKDGYFLSESEVINKFNDNEWSSSQYTSILEDKNKNVYDNTLKQMLAKTLPSFWELFEGVAVY